MRSPTGHRWGPLVLLVGALCGGLVAGCASASEGLDGTSDDGYHGALLEEGYDVPAVTLTADTGQPYDVRADTTKPVTLVFFGYTNCPDVCTTIMASVASALTRLDAEQREQVDVLFVTTDPARDDPAALTAYLDRLDRSFVGLTGDLADIKRLAGALAVFVEKGRRLPTGGYEVSHGTPVIAVGADDVAPLVWTHPTSSSEFATDLVRLLDRPQEGT